MLSKYLDKEKIIEAYSGDGIWLAEIENQLNKIDSDNVEEMNTRYDALNLIQILWKMNYIICETEDTSYAEKYYDKVHELYSEMKIDLTKMLGIEDIWEEM